MTSVEGSQSGYAQALNHCPHAHTIVEKQRADVKDKLNNPCSVCGQPPSELWVCTTCYEVFCGRFHNKHMMQHFETTGHCIAMGTGDLSFWCYSCDSYINHLTIPPVMKVYSLFHQIKFGAPPANNNDTPSSPDSPMSTDPVAPAPVAPEQKAEQKNHWMVDGLDEKVLENPLINKILGCIYGNALGDAIGLATEFLDKKDVDKIYPPTETPIVPFPGYEQNFHSCRWTRGDWTDDTDQMILILDTIVETKGNVDERLFAKKLRYWISNGFPELGDDGGMGLGMTVSAVVRQPQFLTNPHECAKKVWLHCDKNAAANGAVMRTSLLGCYQYNDMDKVIANTKNIAQVTHWDPRCVASCVAVTTAIAYVLQGRKADTPEEIDAISKLAEAHALECDLGDFKQQFLEHMYAQKIEDLKLDEGRAIGYTLKCFGSGFFAFRSQADFKTTINTIIREAGDADTNGAVAGAMIGCRLGYSQLPRDYLVGMPNKKWLDKRVVGFLRQMGLIDG